MKTNTEILAAVTDAATARAAKLCTAALETLAAGRKTFVKGKPVMVPWSDDKRAQLRSLQESAFTTIDGAAEQILFGIVGEQEVSEALEEQMLDAWKAAGLAEIARRFE